jgi:hypothetical protein
MWSGFGQRKAGAAPPLYESDPGLDVDAGQPACGSGTVRNRGGDDVEVVVVPRPR